MAARFPLRAAFVAVIIAAGLGGRVLAQPAPVQPPVPTPAQPAPPPPAAPAPQPAAPVIAPAPTLDPQLAPQAPLTLEPVIETSDLDIEPEPPPRPREPMKRGRADAAILQALDKVTAETLRFEAPIGQPVRYKSLVFTVRACESAAPDEVAPEAAAYLTIDSQPRPQPGRAAPPGRQVFRGWMFASSPSLNPLEHPVYDAWVIACRTAPPSPAKR